MNQAELILDARAELAEGPCWDPYNEVLYWVDIKGKNLHIFNPAKNEDRKIHIGQLTGTVVPAENGTAILALENGFHTIDLETEELTLLTDPESHLSENRFNDGKCDAMGRLWAGTMQKDGQGSSGSLYVLNADYEVQKAEENLGISNGLAWNKENTVFYLIDTPTQTVAAYDFELETGRISNKRTVIHVPDEEGFPDGMTIDEEGMLWIAHYNGSQVARWNPETGEKMESCKLPVSQVTCCTFGGPDLNELYVTTGRENLDEDAAAEQPHAGSLFKIQTSAKGLKTNIFKLKEASSEVEEHGLSGAKR